MKCAAVAAVALMVPVACRTWRPVSISVSPSGVNRIEIEDRIKTGIFVGKVELRVGLVSPGPSKVIYQSGMLEWAVGEREIWWSPDSSRVGIVVCNQFAPWHPFVAGLGLSASGVTSSAHAIEAVERQFSLRTGIELNPNREKFYDAACRQPDPFR